MIYCVEDDAGIRELVVYTLRNTGFEADGFGDGAALTTALKKCKPQLILLDIMLPGEDGITILRRLRAAPDTAKIPVILLTAKNTEYDKVVGLDTGADDYIPKPFGMMELIARIRAVLRRTEDMQDKDEPRPLVAGGICVDAVSYTHLVSGLRQTIQGKGRSSKRKGNRRCPFLFAPAADAAHSCTPQSATPAESQAKIRI